MYTGYIYRHYIFIDKREISYIGITSQEDTEQRWLDGWGYINNGQRTLFSEAIVKYGWDNFYHEILIKISCETKEELDEMLSNLEKKYVEEYDSFNNGFNSTTGGIKNYSINSKKTRKVICLTTGEIFNNINEASKHYNIDRAGIGRNVKHIYSYAGRHPITKECLIWAYEDERHEKHEKQQEIRTYKYICYNDQKKYVTYREMSETYNFSIGQIRKCCLKEKEYLCNGNGEKYYFGIL